MTEQPQPNPRPKRRRRPSALPVAAGSMAAFFATFGFMAYQLRTGHDPALGNKTAVALAPTKQVLVKRIERHVILTTVVPPSEGDDGAPASSAPVVVQQVPATVTAAPAPVAAAPAPAPAPAPIVTRTS